MNKREGLELNIYVFSFWRFSFDIIYGSWRNLFAAKNLKWDYRTELLRWRSTSSWLGFMNISILKWFHVHFNGFWLVRDAEVLKGKTFQALSHRNSSSSVISEICTLLSLFCCSLIWLWISVFGKAVSNRLVYFIHTETYLATFSAVQSLENGVPWSRL